ncbi:MAG: membrane-bound lytic murein transglycosylase C [Flavobacteriales bacterium]|jgi:membrane-bound lytic murein transglycosylase C
MQPTCTETAMNIPKVLSATKTRVIIAMHVFVVSATMLLGVILTPNFAIADVYEELDNEVSAPRGTQSSTPNRNNISTREADLEAEFQAWKAAEDAEFSEWKAKYFAELNAYKEKILGVWDVAEVTDKTNWVDYSKDLKTKKVVDYKNNEIRISISDAVAAPTQNDIQHYLEDIITTTPNTARKKDPVLNAIDATASSKDPISNTSMLAGVIATNETEETPKQLPKQLSKHVVNTAPSAPAATNPSRSTAERSAKALSRIAVVTKAKQPKSLDKAAVTTITIKLPKDATYNRAKTFTRYVKSHSKTSNVNSSLIYAIMHTESAFNPMARSAVPAFGLMQIVPGSAGKDVTKKWDGKARLLKPDELYNEQTNIRAGSTYLNILLFSYLKGITNPESRRFCAIAAYNTGAGNVSVAFTGSKKLRNALPVINSMTPKQVYDTLIKKLPYEETKHYLERVVRRQAVYAQRNL